MEEVNKISDIYLEGYDMKKSLDKGSGGIAYKVFSRELRKNRILKIINSEKQNSKEAELMAKLEGKDLENIVQIYEASKNSVKVKKKAVYSIIMEYLDGEKLTSMIKSGLSDDKVLEYSVQIFNGIKSLREHGIFHRDLRPDNIMVMRDYIVKKSWKDIDLDGNFKIKKKDLLKIIDFGIATDKPEAKPKDNRRYGGPNDLFSLGMITYKMQTKENLIKSREEKMSTQTYADTIKELRKKAFDESGLKEKYKQKIRDTVSDKLGNIILSCFEQRTDISDLETLYVNAEEDLKYYFMDKQDLILELELQKSINEDYNPYVDDGIDTAKDLELERLYDEGLIDDDGNIMGNDEEFFEDEENKGSA